MNRRFSTFSRALLAMALFAGCQNPGTPKKDSRIVPTPTPIPVQDGTVLNLDFETGGLQHFVDPVPPAAKQSGKFFLANWKPVEGELRQLNPPTQPSLAFLQYAGNAFGSTYGQAPNKYRVEADVRAYAESQVSPEEMVGSPLGMLAIIPYYLDFTHYLLLVATPSQISLWNVDGMAPQETWDAKKYQIWDQAISPALRAGDPIRLGAEVDVAAQRVVVFFNGEMKAVVDTKDILKEQDHYVALISNGNFVAYDNFKLKKVE